MLGSHFHLKHTQLEMSDRLSHTRYLSDAKLLFIGGGFVAGGRTSAVTAPVPLLAAGRMELDINALTPEAGTFLRGGGRISVGTTGRIG